MEIVLIVAVADNGVIGADGAIPWRLKTDLQRLKALTVGKPVVMGRKTFLSLRRPLPGRTNIVMTRDAGFRGTRCGVWSLKLRSSAGRKSMLNRWGRPIGWR
jgi:dihydrofolate reductase